MPRVVSISLLALTLGIAASPAHAWWDKGHMQIAYLAYKRLSEPVRDKADSLLKLNKDYAKWTAGAAEDNTAKDARLRNRRQERGPRPGGACRRPTGQPDRDGA
jgi:hypothetical protein